MPASHESLLFDGRTANNTQILPYSNQGANPMALPLSADGDFFRSLVKNPSPIFGNLLAIAEKYVNMDEAAKMKEAESLPENKEGRTTCPVSDG
ncbi:hypothetical protein BUALT_Bualt16G0091700 [Buddleja alternifolia]|uniref:Uncharacterized protein n=1 Tax=Buddleja alternifolia TaxID=168488 RepID=A0AAV6WFN3_9LAMI|nr:hypothetical protein BUALT_Bualt16G0091700 [Buddleja alternifolia]